MDKNNVSVGNGNVLTVISVVIAVLGVFFGISYQINTLHGKIDAVQREVGALRAEMQSEIGTLRTEMQSEFGTLRAEMQSEIGTLRADIAELRGEFRGMETRLSNVETGLRDLRTEVNDVNRFLRRDVVVAGAEDK